MPAKVSYAGLESTNQTAVEVAASPVMTPTDSALRTDGFQKGFQRSFDPKKKKVIIGSAVAVILLVIIVAAVVAAMGSPVAVVAATGSPVAVFNQAHHTQAMQHMDGTLTAMFADAEANNPHVVTTNTTGFTENGTYYHVTLPKTTTAGSYDLGVIDLWGLAGIKDLISKRDPRQTLEFGATLELHLGSWRPKLSIQGAIIPDEYIDGSNDLVFIAQRSVPIGEDLPAIVKKITQSSVLEDIASSISVTGLVPQLMFSVGTADFKEVNGTGVNDGIRLFIQIDFTKVTWPQSFQQVFNMLKMSPDALSYGVMKPYPDGFDSPLTMADFAIFANFAVSPPTPTFFHFNEFEIEVSMEASIKLGVGWQLNLDGQEDPLNFKGEAEFDVSGGMTFGGFMVGTWRNVGGIRNFNIANVGGEVAVQICPAGLCPTGFGAWGRVQLKTGSFFDITAIFFPEEGKFAVAAYIQNWGWTEIFELMEKVTGAKLGFAAEVVVQVMAQIRVNSLNLTLAPFRLALPGKTIEKGMGLQADMEILGATVMVNFGLLSRKYVTPSILGYDFQIGLKIENLNLLRLIPFCGLAEWLIIKARAGLQSIGRICSPETCVGVRVGGECGGVLIKAQCFDTPLIAQIDMLLGLIQRAVAKTFVLNALYFEGFSLADMIAGKDNVVMGIDVTLAGLNSKGSLTVKPSFFVKGLVDSAYADLKKLAQKTFDIINQGGKLITAGLKLICNDLNKLACVPSPIPSTPDLCLPSFC